MQPPAERHEALSRELLEELDAQPLWMYPWRLAPGVTIPILGPELISVHQTREEMIEKPVRDALAAAGPRATAIDLACNEGWFSHRLLDWGAHRVVGIDIRARPIRRAELVRDHLGVSRERLEFRRADVFDLDPEDIGAFDVVLALGLIYHLEDPVGAVRIARALTRSLCVIESQLTRQDEPIAHGWGDSRGIHKAESSFAVRYEQDQESNDLAAAGGVLSLIPNRAALAQMSQAAGFKTTEFVAPQDAHNLQYRAGDRAVLLAYAR